MNMEPQRKDLTRKRVVLTIQNKIDICHKLENGESRRKIMEEYDIGSSTVYNIRKQKDEYHKFYSASTSPTAIKQRKTLRKPKLEQLDMILYEWFVIKRSEGSLITGPIFKEKAKEFYEKLGLTEECTFSDGWLAGFKARHGIRRLDNFGEQQFLDSNAPQEYIDLLAKFVEENSLSSEQVYNAVEAGLLWRCLPNKSLAESDENKDKITVLCCANVSGNHRIKLLVVGKYQEPEAFENVPHLPVQYAAQCNAWMNKDIFKDWFLNTFVPSIKVHFISIGLPENSKCLLLLDKCIAYPNELELCSENIFVKYLPTNDTALVQPMNQGVIQSMKYLYRRNFLRKLVDYTGSIAAFQNSFNIKDAIFNIACAWSLVKQETMCDAWKKLWQPIIFDEIIKLETNIADENDHLEEIVSLFQKVSSLNSEEEISPEEVQEWLENDEESVIAYTITDDDLINSVLTTEPPSIPTESFQEEETTNASVSWATTAEAYNTLIKFVNSKPCHSPQEIEQLHALHSIFLRKRQEPTKQTDIRQYFKKVSKQK